MRGFVVGWVEAVGEDARVAPDHVDGVVEGGEGEGAGDGGRESSFFVRAEGGGRPWGRGRGVSGWGVWRGWRVLTG